MSLIKPFMIPHWQWKAQTFYENTVSFKTWTTLAFQPLLSLSLPPSSLPSSGVTDIGHPDTPSHSLPTHRPSTHLSLPLPHLPHLQGLGSEPQWIFCFPAAPGSFLSLSLCLWGFLSSMLVPEPISWPSAVPSFSSVQLSRSVMSDSLRPMNCSTPGLPVQHQLPEFTQTHIHRVSDAIQPSHPLLFPSPPAPNPFQQQSLFQWVNSSHEVAKVLEFQL